LRKFAQLEAAEKAAHICPAVEKASQTRYGLFGEREPHSKRAAVEFFLTIMLNYDAAPGKRYYIQYPSLEFCQAGRRKVLDEHRSAIERVGRIAGLRSIAAVCTSGKRPTRETETERELDSAIRDALGR